MPQMAPINWLLLFTLFIMTYLMFNILNYFIFNMNLNKTEKKLFHKKELNWKW